MSETPSPALFHSFTTKSTPGFESPSQIPPKPKGPNGLDIVLSQGKRFIYYPHGSDAVPNFLDWWNGTPYAAKAREKGRAMNWGSDSRKSVVWDHVNDLAEYPNGNPKVQCMHCKQFFAHPSNGNIGTHGLKTHLEGPKCSSPMSTTPSSGNVIAMMSNPMAGAILT